MEKKQKRTLIILILILTFIDQLLKIIILSFNIKLGNIEGFSIGIIDNTKSESNIQSILISIIAIMLIVRYITSNNLFIKMNSRVILSFAIAGAISNVVDRIWYKSTINYINITKTMQLNLGYIYFFITWVGMAVILTGYTRKRIKERQQKNSKERFKEIYEDESKNNSKRK